MPLNQVYSLISSSFLVAVTALPFLTFAGCNTDTSPDPMSSTNPAPNENTMEKLPNDLDGSTLNQLREAGSDLSKPHDIEFFIYLPNESAANAAAEEIRAHNFSVETKPAAQGSEWLCFTTKTMVPDYDALCQIRSNFDKIAESHGGEYDGWGTPIVK